MAGVALANPRIQFFDALGNPLANGFVDIYLAGTTTRTTTWQDRAKTTANQNPIPLDPTGSCLIVFDSALAYKYVVKNSALVVQSHLGADNVVGAAGAASIVTAMADLEAARVAAIADVDAQESTSVSAVQSAQTTAETAVDTLVTQAETAQAAAEVAADLAWATARLYPDTATALADSGLAVGSYFAVLSASDLEVAIIYLKAAGPVATDTGKRVPSGNVAGTNSGTAVYFIFQGNSGSVLGYWTDSGLYVWSEAAGAYSLLTGAPSQIESNANTSTLAGLVDSRGRKMLAVDALGRLKLNGYGDIFNSVASSDLALAKMYEAYGDTSRSSFLADKALNFFKPRIRINRIACHWNTDAGTSFCRMPSLLPLTATTGLIFFAQRNSFYTAGDANSVRACVRDYTIDYANRAIAFSSTRVIVQPAEWVNATPGGWAANPVAFQVRAGQPNAGRIVLLVNRRDSLNGLSSNDPRDYYIEQYTSDDSGQTWSAGTTVMSKTQVWDTLAGGTGGVPGALPSDRYGVITGTSNSLIRLSATSGHENRIVVALNALPGDTARWYQGAMYSDDEGVTWTRGTFYLAASTQNEAQIVERLDGSILRLNRDDTNDSITQQLRRGQAHSVDGGATWVVDALNTAAALGPCSSTLALAARAASSGAFPRLMAGGPTNSVYGTRNIYRFLMSYDGGTTFPGYGSLVEPPQNYGYGFLVKNSDGNWLWAYETSNTGTNNEESTGLMVFNDAELFANSTLS